MSDEIQIPERKCLGDLQDEVEDCVRMVACIGDLLSRKKADDQPEFSERGYAGFYFMIRNLQDKLESALDDSYKGKRYPKERASETREDHPETLR